MIGWGKEAVEEVPEVEAALLQMFRRGVAVGRRCTAGPHTPAFPDGYSFSVLGIRGEVFLLAHDAFEAARYFAIVERAGHHRDPDWPALALATDAEMARDALRDRYEGHYRYDRTYPNKENAT